MKVKTHDVTAKNVHIGDNVLKYLQLRSWTRQLLSGEESLRNLCSLSCPRSAPSLMEPDATGPYQDTVHTLTHVSIRSISMLPFYLRLQVFPSRFQSIPLSACIFPTHVTYAVPQEVPLNLRKSIQNVWLAWNSHPLERQMSSLIGEAARQRYCSKLLPKSQQQNM
jgi:hypothetical protein